MRRRTLLAGAAGSFALLQASTNAGADPARVTDVRTHGALGDGETDDTSAIQSAIDAACDDTKRLLFPKSAHGYRMRHVEIRKPLAIDLGGSSIQLQGRLAGFYLAGSVPDFSIRNGEIWGDGIFESNQFGVLTSGVGECALYERLEASDLVIGKVVNGLRLEGLRNSQLSRIAIRGTVGVEPGRGYGIAFGNGNRADDCPSENITVEDCDIQETSRHGLYVAGARNVTLRRLTFRRHAYDATVTHYRSALVISRSQEVTAQEVKFIDCNDECFGIDDDAGGRTTRNIEISDVDVEGGRDIIVRIGVAGPWADGTAEVDGVTLTDLRVHLKEASRFCPINIAEARNVTLRGVIIRSDVIGVGSVIQLPAGPAVRRQNITIEDVQADIPKNDVLFSIPPDVHRGAAALTIRNVDCPQGTSLVYAGAEEPTNRNMRIDIDKFSRDITGSSPSIAGASKFRISQVAPTIVETFSHAYLNQKIEIEFADNLTTLRQGRLRLLSSKPDRKGAAGDRISLRWNGENWLEGAG